MSKLLRFVLLLVLLTGVGVPVASAASASPASCQTGTFATGALWMICVPQIWNHNLVVYAHGYTAYNEPLAFQHLTLPDGGYLPDLITSLGFAFATTSYRENGLAILSGVEDIRQLTEFFPTFVGQQPQHTYLTGVSEGGLVTTLGIERYPALFSGGLATCGPVGDFQGQVNYVGDYRVLFDYFFPGMLPPSPISIPQEAIDNWEAVYKPAVSGAVAGNTNAGRQLIRTAKAAVNPAQPDTLVTTTVNVLWYNINGTNDATAKLGGNPYGNRWKWYWGSANDLQLNRNVQRFVADQAALDALTAYQASGNLTRPLVTLHTTADEVVPYWHELLYYAKAGQHDLSQLISIPVFRYGHCNFTTAEVLAAFGLLVWRVTGSQPTGLTMYFSPEQVARDFAQAQREFASAERGQ